MNPKRGVPVDSGNDKKITIDQVAALAGVSKTTVSRFLNGKYDNISVETRERIAKVIKEHDYRPNRSAQRLKAGHTMLIGCVLGDVSSPFSSLLLRGASEACESAGYQMLFADAREDPEREKRAILGFLENRVDGLIINTTGGNDLLITDVHNRGIPVALADRTLAEPGIIDTVVSTDIDSSYECVRFLLGQGYKRIAFFKEGSDSVSPRMLRKKGYEKAMDDYRPGEEHIVYSFSKNDEEGCTQCVKDLIEKYGKERVAIISSNGVTAHHILLSLNSFGITPGYEVGLLTFDDWSWLRLAPPGITTVALKSEEIGAQAARMVINRASGRLAFDAPAEYIEIPTKIMVRGSTPASR